MNMALVDVGADEITPVILVRGLDRQGPEAPPRGVIWWFWLEGQAGPGVRTRRFASRNSLLGDSP
jgi:hypothetical protein